MRNLRLAATGLVLIAVPVVAQNFEWQERDGDRFEGVASEEISGGVFDLVAVHAVLSDPPGDQAERLYLGFWLPAEKRVEIEVRAPGSVHYVMVPKKKTFGAGRGDFSWPTAAVLRPLNLRPSRLHTLVQSEGTYFPAFLSATRDPRPAGRYEFVFDCDTAVRVNATVSRVEDGQLTLVTTLAERDEDPGLFRLVWNGRDKAGKPLTGGLYALRITGELDTETPESFSRVYYFQHHDSSL